MSSAPRIVIIGGGIISLELGQFFARLGVEVTVIEAAPRLLAREDEDVSEVITKRLEVEGVRVLVGVKLARRINPALFYRLVYLGMTATGMKLVYDGFIR